MFEEGLRGTLAQTVDRAAWTEGEREAEVVGSAAVVVVPGDAEDTDVDDFLASGGVFLPGAIPIHPVVTVALLVLAALCLNRAQFFRSR